ncbi:hypothetical protein N7470_001773 [Penicillium chermesinum]|nr:hypothetical protein N7470_001773 [Penicillium chermesinum]
MAIDSSKEHAPGTGATTIGDNNSITRCELRNCAVTSSNLKRSTFTDCALSAASKSHLHDVYAVERSDLSHSAVTGRSAVHRSTVISSTVRDASSVKRSSVTNSLVLKGELWRATVTDCDIGDCIIHRSEFTGVILKYGVWKRGKLVGRIGNREPVMVSKGGTHIPAAELPPTSALPMVSERDVKSAFPPSDNEGHEAFDMSSDDESLDNEPDLPPPYKV